jgi:hypothetical protein
MAKPGNSQEFAPFVAGLRQRIRLGRRRIWLLGNRERLGLYWNLGHALSTGGFEPDEVSKALRSEDPIGEFNSGQLQWMRRFAKAWPDEAEVRMRLGHISWHKHRMILQRLRSDKARRAYVEREWERSWEGRLP